MQAGVTPGTIRRGPAQVTVVPSHVQSSGQTKTSGECGQSSSIKQHRKTVDTLQTLYSHVFYKA